ncbi:MAG: hypothetical protein SPL21_13750 [Fibrobacter sp.]|jgi:hypothetical protein|nr:hypothetical protein [Fibrobacter sp.]
MKYVIPLVLVLIISSLAEVGQGHCEKMYRKFIEIIPKQKTKVCRVTGIEEDRTDIMGFFFDMEVNGHRYPAVFVYGSDFDEMLYAAPSDEFARTAKCIEGGGFRTIYRWMTPEQIVANLLSHKECEDDFDHPVKMGKITTSQE